jgi:uncharacterized membrane protein
MDWIQVAVQWLHVLAAITWFGAVIYGDFILIPALMTLPPDVQRAAGGAIGLRAMKVIPGAAIAVIVLGILRGTVWGRIHSVSDVTTTYGLLWLVALVLAIATYAFAKVVIEPGIARINAVDPASAIDATGRPNAELAAAVDAVKRASLAELGLFLVIFTCMILMRFN